MKIRIATYLLFYSSFLYSARAQTSFQEVAQEVEHNMVWVERGTFLMSCHDNLGFECYKDEKPTHYVTK